MRATTKLMQLLASGRTVVAPRCRARGQKPGTKPAPNDLRMAFPPST
jgi:hypothetical protein